MNLTLKKLGLAAVVAASVAIPVAYASGIFQGYPIVGSAAFCDSNNVQQTTATVPGQAYSNSNCTTTVPAGPANVPSTAVLPADTGLSQGRGPQTVLIPAVLTGSVALDAAPLTGTTITVPQGVSQLVVDPAGTIAALTVVLPPASQLVDGQEFKMSTTQTITALTVTAGANTSIVSTAVTTLGPTTAALDLIYHAATGKWVSG